MESERQFGTAPGAKADAARAGDVEPRRRRVNLPAQVLATKGEHSRNLTDTLVANKQIVHAEPNVVTRGGERPAAAGGELDEA